MIVETLEKIISLTSVRCSPTDSLRPGLSIELLEDALRDFPFPIPDAVKALYQWHDGSDDEDYQCTLFYYHTFLPIERSMEIRATWDEYNTEDQIVYEPDLLPLFEFEGEYYCIRCDDTLPDAGSIWFVHHDGTIVYNSLLSMLSCIVECYETGAYEIVVPDDENSDDLKIDEQRVAEIKLKHNSVRQETFDRVSQYTYGKIPPYYHP